MPPLKPTPIVAALFAVFAFPACVEASDWPQWRGPSSQGFTPEAGLPNEFPKDGLKLLWKVELKPEGQANTCMDNGSPVAALGCVFVTARCGGEGKGAETLHCLDLKDGKSLWATTYCGKGGIANATPSVDVATGKVYVNRSAAGSKIEGSYGIACLDAKTGKVLWGHDEARLGLQGQVGDAGSPVLGEKVVYSACLEKVFAFEKQTGDILWSWPEKFAEKEKAPAYRSSKGEDGEKYKQWYEGLDRTAIVGIKSSSTPLLISLNNRPLLIQGVKRLADTGYCSSTVILDANTGKLLALMPWVGSHHTPVFSDGLLVSSVFEGESGAADYAQKYFMVAHELSWNNEALALKEAWRTNSVGKRYRLPSPIVVNKTVYWRDHASLYAVELQSGKIKWNNSVLPGKQWPITSPIVADAKIIHVAEDGQLRIFTDDGSGPKELLSQEVSASTNATPIVADGKLVLRDRSAIYCYNLKN